jgi:hypothetical protein
MGQTPTRLRKGIKRSVKRTRNRFDHRPVAHFLHIGKTGGTALRFALHDVRSATAYRLVLHGHRAHLDGIPVGEKFFYSVRDPIDRYVSGFLSRQRQGRPSHFRPWTEGEATAFSLFDSPEALGAALSVEDGVQRAAAEHAMRSISHLSSSYWKWFDDPSYFKSRADDLLWIGRQDALDVESLARALGVDELSLPEDPTIANRAQGPKPELSDLVRQNLRQWYAKDYEFLGLCDQLFPLESRPNSS